jgi:hypothetical protein
MNWEKIIENLPLVGIGIAVVACCWLGVIWLARIVYLNW